MKKAPEKKKDPKKAAAEGVVEIKGDPESLGLPTEKFYYLIDWDFRNKNEKMLKPWKHQGAKTEMSSEDKNKEIVRGLTDKYDIVIPMKEWLLIKVAIN